MLSPPYEFLFDLLFTAQSINVIMGYREVLVKYALLSNIGTSE
jgi:hypothetical protein